MNERERRNQVEEAELYVETEFLVFGAFREDDDDHGFMATRWLPASELETVIGRPMLLLHLARPLLNPTSIYLSVGSQSRVVFRAPLGRLGGRGSRMGSSSPASRGKREGSATLTPSQILKIFNILHFTQGSTLTVFTHFLQKPKNLTDTNFVPHPFSKISKNLGANL